MYLKKLTVLFVLIMILTLTAQVPRTLNYQGKLTDPDGVAIEGPVEITFRIYDDPTAGTLLWEEDHIGGDAIDVANGLFDVILGNLVTLNLPFDEEYWVELEIEGEVLDPREKLSSVAYAHRAIHADTAEYVISGGTADNDWTELTTPADYIEAKAGGIASNGAVLHGTAANTHINLGYNSSVTGASGFDYTHSTVGGGYQNTASNTQATVSGGFANVASGNQSTVGGGGGNAAGGYRSVVAGGVSNTASGARTTIGGGQSNLANADAAFVGGGNNNTSSGQGSMVGAGEQNTSSNWYSVVAGGRSNTSEGYGTAIGGGRANTVSDSFSVVSGGYQNTVENKHSAILGGYANRLTGEHSYLFGIADTVDYDSTFYVGSTYSRFAGEMHLGNVPDDVAVDSILTIDEGQVKKVAATSISGTDNDWSRSGNYVYTFNTSDSVGIGTTSPQSILSLAPDNTISVATTDGSDNGYLLISGGGGYGVGRGAFIRLRGNESSTNPGTLVLTAGTSAHMILNASGSSGFVGIRDDNPNAQLEISNDGSANDLFMLSSTDAGNGDRFIVKNTGNVGIGNTSPAEKLEVTGNILLSTGGNRSIRVEEQTTGLVGYDLTIAAGDLDNNGTAGDLILRGGHVAYFQAGNVRIYGGNSDDSGPGGDVYIYGGLHDGASYADGDVILSHNGLSRRGYVGIGTDEPAYELEVAAGIPEILIDSDYNADEDGDKIGSLIFGDNRMDERAQILVEGDGEGDDGDTPTRMSFYTTPNGTDTWQERMRIDNSGNVGIGIEYPTAQLHTDGSVRFEGAGTPGDGKVLTSDASGNATWQTIGLETQWTDDSANDRIYNNNAITEYDRVLVEDDGDLQVTDGELRVMMVEPITPPSSVTTLFSGGNGGYGNMFDLTTSSEAVRIVELDCNIDRSESVTVDVYYRLNSSVGRESSSSGWILEGEYTVMAMGEGNPTNIVIGGVNIPASSTYGFYILVTSGGFNPISYTNGTATNYTDGTLTIRTNCGNPGTPFGTPFSDRRWNGTVHYTTDAPSYIPLTIADGFIEFPEINPFPTTPPADYGRLFVKDDSKIYFKDDAGTEYDLTSGGGGSDDDWAYSSGSGLSGDIYHTGDVAIGASSPDISAKIDVSASDKGALFPRMSTESRDGIASPAQGLLIYNTDTDCFNYYFDGDWFSLCGELSSQDKLTYRYSDGTPYRFTNTTGSGMTVTVKCWGGGGGGNGNDELDQGFGGGGGFVQGDIYLSDGEYLDIEPAEGGPVGGGGGASIITHSTNGVILVAGGGGGAGACGGSSGPLSSHGGAGGGFVGENGTDQSTTGTYTFSVVGGGGGTQSSGGLGGTAWTDRPSVSMCDGDDGGSLFGGTMYSGSGCGSSYSGGNRDDAGNGCSNGCGGSGGSGYYGGGAGGSVYTYRGAGGGGGSSYFANWPQTREPHFTIGGEGQIAGNMHDPDYQFSAGLGGYPGTPGKDGLVVIILD